MPRANATKNVETVKKDWGHFPVPHLIIYMADHPASRIARVTQRIDVGFGNCRNLIADLIGLL